MTERQRIRKLLSRLNRQPRRLFPPERHRLDAPKTHGVYVIRNRNGRVLHVGRTLRGREGLFQRLRDHLASQSSFVNSYLAGNGRKLRSGYTYQYLEVRSDRARALLEHCATAWHCPRHLGLGASRRGRGT
jgi:hypothetical protein